MPITDITVYSENTDEKVLQSATGNANDTYTVITIPEAAATLYNGGPVAGVNQQYSIDFKDKNGYVKSIHHMHYALNNHTHIFS